MSPNRTLHFEEEKLIHLPVEDLFAFLSDSNHLNHYIGLFPVAFSPFKKEEGRFYREAKAKVFGFFPVEWKEHTFSWVRNQWYEVERIYAKGPVERILWQIHTTYVDEGKSLLKIKGDFRFRNTAGRFFLTRFVLPKLRKIFSYTTAYEEQGPLPHRPQATTNVKADRELLDHRLASLGQRNVPKEMLSRLRTDLLRLDDEELSSLRPYRWARDTGFDRQEAVRFFLLATKEGVLEQHWNLLCPNCRVPKADTTSLAQVSGTVHCDLCGMDYELDFDRLIEMQFRPHPSIRKAEGEVYCMNGPMNAPHILAQFRMAPGQSQVHIPEVSSPVRFRILGDNAIARHEKDHVFSDTMTITEEGFDAGSYSPGGGLTVNNRTNGEIVLVLEETLWDEDALTAREVTSLQLFRDLFDTEVLSPDQEIHVSNMTILFTDLKASTRMYEKIGDAPAYADVRRHFDFLREHVQHRNGAIIKTIGDSVMAAFSKEADALQAALDIQGNIRDLQEKVKEPIEIKIGLHSGPVIAVNANGLLDYFGRTVNLASRIGEESLGGDVVLTEEIFSRMKKAPEDSSDFWEIEALTIQPKGMRKEKPLIRLTKRKRYAEMKQSR